MENLLIRNLLWTAPAVLTYTVLIPAVALSVDGRLGLGLPAPGWIAWLAWPLIAAGPAVALWSAWELAALGRGTPNPIAPPVRLVARGPYRYSRNPMMLSGWLAGLGLALVLRSPSLLAAYAIVTAAGALYIRFIEEPRLVDRFGSSYTEYARVTPRWVRMCHGLSHHAKNG